MASASDFFLLARLSRSSSLARTSFARLARSSCLSASSDASCALCGGREGGRERWRERGEGREGGEGSSNEGSGKGRGKGEGVGGGGGNMRDGVMRDPAKQLTSPPTNHAHLLRRKKKLLWQGEDQLTCSPPCRTCPPRNKDREGGCGVCRLVGGSRKRIPGTLQGFVLVAP